MSYKDELNQFDQKPERVLERMEKMLDCIGFEYAAKGFYDGSMDRAEKGRVSLPVKGSALDIMQDASLRDRIEAYLEKCYHGGYNSGRSVE